MPEKLFFWLRPAMRFVGMRIPHPTTVSAVKMLRLMRAKRKKRAASIPTVSINACSFVLSTGPSHDRGAFPTGGGACFESACFARGAYTTLLSGRRKQKTAAQRAARPNDETRELRKADVLIWPSSVTVRSHEGCKTLQFPGSRRRAVPARPRLVGLTKSVLLMSQLSQLA